MTKMNEIKKMKDGELTTFINEKRESIRSFRFGTGGRDVNGRRTARKEIARALTELKTRNQGEDIAPNA